MDIKSKSLFKNTIVYAIGNFGSKLLSFCLLPIYSYYLTKEEFGYYDIVITTITLLVPIVTMQLSDSIFRWLITSNGNVELIKTIITNAFTFVIINIVLVIILSIIGTYFFPLKNMSLIILLLISSTIFPVIQQSVRGLQESKSYAISGLIFSVVLLITNIILLIVFNMAIEALFIASILANVTASTYLFFKINVIKYFSLHFIDFNKVKELLLYSSPLVPNAISWWLIMSANKYIVLYYLGTEALGIFGFSNRFPALLVMVNSIFILAWQESAILNFNKKDREVFFSKIFNLLIKIQFSFAIILILSSEIMVRFLISDAFYDSWNYMPILYIGVAFSTLASFYGSMYLGAKDTKASLITTLVSGIANIVLAFILVKPYGLYGISIANAISFIILFLYRCIHTQKYMELTVSKKVVYLILILLVISLYIVYLNSRNVSIVALILLFTIIIFLNKQPIKILITQAKNINGFSKLRKN